MQGERGGVGQGSDLVDDDAKPGAVVTRPLEQGAELGLQSGRGAVGEHDGQVGHDGPLMLPAAFLVGAVDDVAVGQGLENGALQAGMAGHDKVGAVSGEALRPVPGTGGLLGGHAEPADELAGGVLQAGLGKGGAVVGVRPPVLGDEPVLETHVTYYQRLLAKDQDEATDLVEEYLKTHPAEEVYDRVLLPALALAKENEGRGELTPADEEFIFQVTSEMLGDLALARQKARRDAAEMGRLADAGRIALVADGTPVQVVGTGTMMLRLRVLAGPHEGREGWVRKEFVRSAPR